jgi:glycogen debranching enzyme
MPVEIHVGPPVITINQGTSFMITDLKGEVSLETDQGIYARDTRFLSFYAAYLDGIPWSLLTSSMTRYYAASFYLTNEEVATEHGTIAAGTLGLAIHRAVIDGIHEDIDITNYDVQPVRFSFEVVLRSDFADLFEVRTRRFVRRGHVITDWDAESSTWTTRYRHQDFERGLRYRIDGPLRPHYANGRITWDVVIEPGETWHACGLYELEYDGEVHTPDPACHDRLPLAEPDRALRRWIARTPTIAASDPDLERLYRQSVEDLNALSLEQPSEGDGAWLPLAGVPWFVTVFGRDTLITSLQTMPVHTGMAYGTLRVLADYQATERDDWRDAEPGKIMHEIRYGELAHFKRIPHTPYYGTADATPLYLIVLHEAWKWTGDELLLRRHLATAERCLEWIDAWGDLDGDGFQEHQTRSGQGYENVGWKDGIDSVVYPDGRPVEQPKALCELQGYVFDAWMRMAEAYDALGEARRASELRERARRLQVAFDERFWCEEIGSYAFALDRAKERVPTVVSNAGHALWSGIATPEHAERVVRRMMQPDMLSGWGVRTLASSHRAFNPFAYQRGAVWPHDNGILALGFSRYGFAEEAAEVARQVLDAARSFVSYRVPELWAGVQRPPHVFPVQYTNANVPQAWAAGSVFHLLQAMMGLRADAPTGRLMVAPQLPPWLADIELRGVRVGGAVVDIRCWRDEGGQRWDATLNGGVLDVVEEAWAPW